MASFLPQTPLHLATLTGQSNVVRHLVAAGATLDLRNQHGNTALHIACENGDLEVAKALLKPITTNEMQQYKPSHYSVQNKSSPLQLWSGLIDAANYDGECRRLRHQNFDATSLRTSAALTNRCAGRGNWVRAASSRLLVY